MTNQDSNTSSAVATHKPIVSLLLAVAVLGVAVVWLTSGPGLIKRPPRPVFITRDASEQATQAIMAVRVATSTAQPYQAEVLVQGTSAATRTLTLRSELAGRIVALAFAKGEPVLAGELVVQLDDENHRTHLSEVQAQLKYRRLEYEASTRLHSRGLSAQTKLAESRARLEAARAEHKRALKKIADSKINAPFAGTLNTRAVEIGDYVRVADALATLVDLSNVIVRASVSERERTMLKAGQTVFGNFKTNNHGGDKTASRQGVLRYISSVADASTHTYAIEAEFVNESGELIDGQSVLLQLPGPQIAAHLLPASALTLNTDGVLGVKLIDNKQQVSFQETTVIAQTRAGSWVINLPKQCQVVVVGQDSIAANDTVKPVDVGSMRSLLPKATH